MPERTDGMRAGPGGDPLVLADLHALARRHPRHAPAPPLGAHRVDEHTYILRQSKASHPEAPFLYLLFGTERALLLDTGAVADPGPFPLRAEVDRLVDAWLSRHPRPGYDLVVAHSHGHADHVAGDGQFAGRPHTTVVGHSPEAVRAFFALGDAHADAHADAPARFDLGGRVLDVLAIPGHHRSSIALFDPWTGFLLTGDTVLPGRLYVQDMAAYRASLDRLCDLARTRPVRWVMGCHIEMRRTPGHDYAIYARTQPDEAPLTMAVGRLEAVRQALAAAEVRGPGVTTFADFAVYHGPCRAARLVHRVRLVARNALGA